MTKFDESQDCMNTKPPNTLTNVDLVKHTFEKARAAAHVQGKNVGYRRVLSPVPRHIASQRWSWSGSGPDIRDPQPFGKIVRDLTKKRGWSAQVTEGTVFGQWASVVGKQIADHASPIELNDGVLSIVAESTAWATQLRIMQTQLLAKITTVVGKGVVVALKITGPVVPSWRKGPRHIAGRGPRDTYG
ncbi:DUF721 domain-containing protein [Mycobacterium uberis]|uniref:UPF0232 protein MUBE_01080 n=1 Tax=Mycobacterium uberis TaxID=2162698 RepID=A0A3E1HLL7_9MYCO|nr:DUF721 family protein [Mycobacterium uberis]RFD27237.1 DUF721 domain-containing protein [Mycobacterium uberis]